MGGETSVTKVLPGFIGDVASCVGDVRKANSDLMPLLDEISDDCIAMLASLDVKKDCLPQVLGSSLFARSLEHFHAAVLVAQRGMDSAAHVILRAQLETLFTLAAITKKPDLASQYVDSATRIQLANSRRIRDAKSFPEEHGELFSDDAISKLEELVRTQKVEKLSVERLARVGGMHAWYLWHYPLHSGPAHSDAQSIEDYCTRDTAGEIVSFDFSVDIDELRALMAVAGLYLLKSQQVLLAIYEAPVMPDWTVREKKLLAILNDSRCAS